MKYKKYLIQLAVGLLLSVVVMQSRGAFRASASAAQRILAVTDGFSVTALLWLSVGTLLWAATTGIFDIFGFAFKKAAHAFIPGMIHDEIGSFYDFKVRKQNRRKTKEESRIEAGIGEKAELSTLLVGVVFLVLSLIMTAVWYRVAG